MIETQALELLDSTGARVPAEVFISEGEDEFSVRIHLSEFGLMPRCYGACRNLVVSGMAAQMGGGLAGYLNTSRQRRKWSR